MSHGNQETSLKDKLIKSAKLAVPYILIPIALCIILDYLTLLAFLAKLAVGAWLALLGGSFVAGACAGVAVMLNSESYWKDLRGYNLVLVLPSVGWGMDFVAWLLADISGTTPAPGSAPIGSTPEEFEPPDRIIEDWEEAPDEGEGSRQDEQETRSGASSKETLVETFKRVRVGLHEERAKHGGSLPSKLEEDFNEELDRYWSRMTYAEQQETRT